MTAIQWKQFENLVADQALNAIRTILDKKPYSFYAAAFHEFYAESEELIAFPCLALNTVEDQEKNEDSKWSSPDWKWTNVRYADPILKKLQRAIQKDAA